MAGSGSFFQPDSGVKRLKTSLKGLIRNWVLAFVAPRPLVGLLYLPRYFKSWQAFSRMASGDKLRLRDSHPCLTDWTFYTAVDPHYFYQSGWLARKLVEKLPVRHFDIGSSVMMIGAISAVHNTVFIDYRPPRTPIEGVQVVCGNITGLPLGSSSVASLSCLHVIEHIGLGRYGDPIDPAGSLEAAAELRRVLRPDGRLYVSMPIGRERICFNAHRVFSPASVLAMFEGLRLTEFSYVDDRGKFRTKADWRQAAGCEYGCGLFEFVKSPDDK